MLEVKGLTKSFHGNTVVDDISFKINLGEKVSILGPGSCGKSIILKMVLGLIPPDRGEITLIDKDMINGDEKERKEALKQVGVAFQQGALFDHLNVQGNLRIAMEYMTDYNAERMDQNIVSLLKAIQLPHIAPLYPFELSGGMQRRVGVARALSTQPKFAIFDEPTSGLDPVTSTIILNMISSLIDTNGGSSSIITTSSVEVAIRFAKRILVINNGRVVGDGPWKELLLKGSDWVRYFLGVRLKGIDIEYARELELPEEFITENFPSAKSPVPKA